MIEAMLRLYLDRKATPSVVLHSSPRVSRCLKVEFPAISILRFFLYKKNVEEKYVDIVVGCRWKQQKSIDTIHMELLDTGFFEIG